MSLATRTLLVLALGALAPTAVAQNSEKPDLFLAGWLDEQLDRDLAGALLRYEQVASDETRPKSQRALARARLGERHWMAGRRQDLLGTYQALARLGIDPRNPIAADSITAMGQLSKQFRDALEKPASNERERALGRLRQGLADYLKGAQRPGRRRAVTLRPLVLRVVQIERQPTERVEDQELRKLNQRWLEALEQGQLRTAARLRQQINQKRNQLPARDASILQRTRGRRMAWITETHLRNETELAERRERMLFPMPRQQENVVTRRMRRLRQHRTTDKQRRDALTVVRQRIQQIASRPAISQWEREVLEELDAHLGEHADKDDDVMEALELVARLPYRYELLRTR
ncbi:MAG: hypothetical protein ACYS5W_10845 [Planctomycetota bacterium]|jgi:hypothetical protein